MSKWAPDSREADSWFSDEQLEKLTPADAVDDGLNSPIPTQMVSNGEYMPDPQTTEQKKVEARLRELADQASKNSAGTATRRATASSSARSRSFGNGTTR